jgi:hypothetical protein
MNMRMIVETIIKRWPLVWGCFPHKVDEGAVAIYTFDEEHVFIPENDRILYFDGDLEYIKACDFATKVACFTTLTEIECALAKMAALMLDYKNLGGPLPHISFCHPAAVFVKDGKVVYCSIDDIDDYLIKSEAKVIEKFLREIRQIITILPMPIAREVFSNFKFVAL